MIHAAGILYVTAEGKALFLRRATGADAPGVWCLPGGVVEDGETALQAACREFKEEAGIDVDPATCQPWTRRLGGKDGKPGKEEVDFTTFICTGQQEVEPKINSESDSAVWSPVNSPPQPLHPGCAIALARCSPGWTELDTARAIRAGELMSPQKYENVWLFAVRVTGTGMAYRHKMDEYVWRDKSLYLNDEFLQRCNGLPVILEHPDSNVLNSEEFDKRMVGVVVLPYIKGEEVWGIAKIYDDAAARMMREGQLSTSPAVVWRSPDSNDSRELKNGQKFLIEGKPSLLDHLAICKVGVWDKGGEPVGIDSRLKGDTAMPDEVKPVDKKADENDLSSVLAAINAVGQKMDTLATRIDSVEVQIKEVAARKDADFPPEAAGDGPPPEVMEKIEGEGDADEIDPPPILDGEEDLTMLPGEDAIEGEGDPEPLVADEAIDSARRDAARKDAARRDAGVRGDSTVTLSRKDYDKIMSEIAGVKAAMPKQLTDEDHDKFSAAQARADAVYSGFGKSAPRPLQGESLLAYRRRLLTDLKEHSADWKNSDLRVVAVDDATMAIAENQIYAAATIAVRNPASVPLGMLREIKTKNDAGHTLTSFVGSPSAWMTRFAPTGRAVRQINQPNKGSTNIA